MYEILAGSLALSNGYLGATVLAPKEFQGLATDKNVHPTDQRPTLNISGAVDCNAGANCRTLRITNTDCFAIPQDFT
jgi:hypothetical protein